jgi:hypothetical protein
MELVVPQGRYISTSGVIEAPEVFRIDEHALQLNLDSLAT